MEKHTKTNREYLSYIADRIFKEHPSSEVILNTMIDMEEKGYSRGYQAGFADRRRFKDAQEARRKTSWNTCKDSISDKCSKATIESTNENTSNE
jgi:hypothetical protein